MTTEALEKCRERFFSFVIETSECWLYSGAKDDNGYGRFWFVDQMRLAHHISWLLAGNPAESYLRHTCNNSTCVNPGHLIPGTHADNMRDLALAGTHSNRKSDPDVVLKLHAEGWSLREIGNLFGVSKQAVRTMIIRHTSYKAFK